MRAGKRFTGETEWAPADDVVSQMHNVTTLISNQKARQLLGWTPKHQGILAEVTRVTGGRITVYSPCPCCGNHIVYSWTLCVLHGRWARACTRAQAAQVEVQAPAQGPRRSCLDTTCTF